MIAGNATGAAVTGCSCIGIAKSAGRGQAARAPDAPNGTITTMQLATLPNLRVFLEERIVHSRRNEGSVLEVALHAKAVDLDHSLTAEQTNILLARDSPILRKRQLCKSNTAMKGMFRSSKHIVVEGSFCVWCYNWACYRFCELYG